MQQDFRRVTGVTVSDQTVRKRLSEVSLRPRRPVGESRLTQQLRTARLLFSRSHVYWQLRQRRPVLFTDESRFPLTQSDGHQSV
jgi:Transposase.